MHSLLENQILDNIEQLHHLIKEEIRLIFKVIKFFRTVARTMSVSRGSGQRSSSLVATSPPSRMMTSGWSWARVGRLSSI